MSKSEDYKYIVVNCSPTNFNTICNLSLSVCQIFGYSREELIGHSYNYLLPELFSVHQRNLLQNKVSEFKKKLLIKNEKIRPNSWNDNSFSRNKMKYLVPVKIRWTLVSSEDEKIYAIGKIITDNKTPTELEQEIIYVLTDKNLIIQNFTPNAPKLLYLYSSAINNNLDITDFIKEFNEDYISNMDDLEEIKESNISNFTNFTNNTTKRKMKYIKTEIIKKCF
jgi:PAS domain S-box-containing protein